MTMNLFIGNGLTRPINMDQNKCREKRLAALILPSYWRRWGCRKRSDF